MGSNVVIVESKNDKFFFDAIIRHLNCSIEIAPPLENASQVLISQEDYREMDGLDSSKLKKALKDLQAEIQKGEIERIGVIIDADNSSIEDRISLINECIQEVFPGSPMLQSICEFINLVFEDFDIQLACYITNVDGQGELETVLRRIKNKPSPYADCLSYWRSCVESNNKTISEKEFDKFWVTIYLRYDTCSNNDRRQAQRKCSLEYAMENKTEIWDFNHCILDELKHFFGMFC